MLIRILDLLFVVAIVLLSTAASLQALDSGQRISFAIITEKISTDDKSLVWIPAGVCFELEKRLERCDALRPVDRLKLNMVLRKNSNDSTLTEIVRKELSVDCIVAISTTVKNEELSLQADISYGEPNEVKSITAAGGIDQFFVVLDKLTDHTLTYLRSTYNHPSILENCKRLNHHATKSVKAYGLMILGKEAQQNGKMREAREILNKSLKIDPNLWWSHYFLGAVEFHEGQYGKASEECLTAIKIDSDLYPPVYANLSYCYKGLVDHQKAEQARLEFEKRTGHTVPERPVPRRNFSIQNRKND